MVFHEKPISSTMKVLKKSKSLPPQLNHPKRSPNGSSVRPLRSRIKEMGPICKSRKKYEKDPPASKQLAKEDADFDWVFDKSFQVNQEDYLWLSSESLSPLYNVGDFKFMSPRDYSIDERLVSLLSSWVDCRLFRDKRVHSFDGANANPIKKTSLALLDPVESTMDSSVQDSLINLEGEDCKLISIVESESENLESDFPSPSYKTNSVTNVDYSSSMRSAQDELLSGSVDLDEMNFDEPLIWPFGDNLHWSSTLEFFCQSPRRGLGSSTAFLMKNNSKKSRHHKELWKRRIVVASKIVEFKRGSSKNTKSNHSKQGNNLPNGKKQKLRSGKRLRTMSLVGIDEFNWRSSSYSCSSSMDFDASGWSVSLINLNAEDSEWISKDTEDGLNSNFPSPSYKKNQESHKGNSFQEDDDDDVICGPTNWDQMDADGPLFWPYGKEDQNWSVALDNFNVSPRKGNSLRSRSSIRVRIHDQREGLRRGLVGVVGLNASKIVGFKRVRTKKKSKGVSKSRFGRKRSVAEKMDVVMENDDEDESMLEFGEFDGHEGIDMEFQIHNFSILEE